MLEILQLLLRFLSLSLSRLDCLAPEFCLIKGLIKGTFEELIFAFQVQQSFAIKIMFASEILYKREMYLNLSDNKKKYFCTTLCQVKYIFFLNQRLIYCLQKFQIILRFNIFFKIAELIFAIYSGECNFAVPDSADRGETRQKDNIHIAVKVIIQLFPFELDFILCFLSLVTFAEEVFTSQNR